MEVKGSVIFGNDLPIASFAFIQFESKIETKTCLACVAGPLGVEVIGQKEGLLELTEIIAIRALLKIKMETTQRIYWRISKV